MKRILSLVLELAMTMTLVTLTAEAKEFTDDDAVNYDEAVTVLSEIKVIDGYADGSFHPEGTLTRGAAAKIICNLILGPKTASALTTPTAPFPDVPADHTFAGYIAYCANEGIINGYEDGTFRPAGTLTGNAFMKMLLGALGYDPIVEGFVGTNWSISVLNRALSIELNKRNEDFNGSLAVKREEACLYALNMLTSTMVEYEKKNSVTIGDVAIVSNSSAKEVTRNANEKDFRGGKEGANGTLQFCEKYFPDLTYEEGTDGYMRPSREWFLKGESVCVGTDASKLLGSRAGLVTKKNLCLSIGTALVDKIVDEGEPKYRVEIYCNGSLINGADNDDPLVTTENLLQKDSSAGTPLAYFSRGSVTEIYYEENYNDTGTNLLRICVRTDNCYQVTSGYTAASGKITAVRKSGRAKSEAALPETITIKQADFNVSDLQTDDYILVGWSHADKEVQYVTKARTVSGMGGGVRRGTSVEIDGASYTWDGRDNVRRLGGGNYNYTDEVVISGTTTKGIRDTWQDQLDESRRVIAVLDNRGSIIWIDSMGAGGQYVYVAEIAKAASGLSTQKPNARLYFTDGNDEVSEIVKLVASDGKSYTRSADIVNHFTADGGGKWYRFSGGANGYTLYYVNELAIPGCTDTLGRTT
ncbi:MAG: S-layer homology domain-containing protein, partial [Oscillibacter sp.]|nr:S-layer homology domain-containing protein [Oscillibacter sp.]